MIKVESLSKRYRSLYAIRDVSFEVSQGEVVGFLGPNGAGKSTTMKILTCYLPPSSGSATIEGKDVETDSLEIRRLIGYLPESTPLYTEMSAIDYLRFIGRARGLSSKTLKDRIEYVVDATDIRKVLYKDLFELSKGFRQRVGLAQALLHDPPILILDEPTTGLDPLQRIEIRTLIREIGKTKTVILSTHILSEAEATCDRLIIINLGTIVGDGTPQQLIMKHGKKSRYRVLIRGDRGKIQNIFEKTPFIREIRCEGRTPEGIWIYDVTPETPGITGGELIYELVKEHDWSLAEMAFDRTTLEDVFKKLTGGSSDRPAVETEVA
ncbi:MAG: ATP-binding cassette domain-containing protein [Planctomycetota bacterium]